MNLPESSTNTPWPENREKPKLPDGVLLRTLQCHEDQRGSLSEFYRAEWFPDLPSVQQYQVLHSAENVVRGFHVHAWHHDYLSAIAGAFLLTLMDMRPDSPSHKLAATLTLSSDNPQVIHIPPGVGHGFYHRNSCSMLLGVSHYWNKDDELACRWDDPELTVDWQGVSNPQLSNRDETAGTYDQMQALLLTRMHSS